MPPPPPPPLCFPGFSKKKEPKRLAAADLSRSNTEKSQASARPSTRPSTTRSRSAPGGSPKAVRLERNMSDSTVNTMRTKSSARARDALDEEDEDEKLAFDSDSEAYDDVPMVPNASKARLVRGDTGRSKATATTMSRQNSGDSAGTRGGASPASAKWGYGWGVGKPKDSQREKDAVLAVGRKDSMDPLPRPPLLHHSDSKSSKRSGATAVSKRSASRPNLWASDSQSTLVGSAFERKINDIEVPKEKVDTSERLNELRRLMAKDTLDY